MFGNSAEKATHCKVFKGGPFECGGVGWVILKIVPSPPKINN